MPNWTYNVVYFEDEEVGARAREMMESDKSGFDFDKIKPMPESLNLEAGGRTNLAIAYYLSDGGKNVDNVDKKYFGEFELNSPEELVERAQRIIEHDPSMEDKFREMGEVYVSNFDQYGATHWYDWRNENWGCKWNASEVSWEEDSVAFNTPWGPPVPVLEELSRQLGVTLEIEFEQEGEGLYETIVSPDEGFNENCKFTPDEFDWDDDEDEEYDEEESEEEYEDDERQSVDEATESNTQESDEEYEESV